MFFKKRPGSIFGSPTKNAHLLLLSYPLVMSNVAIEHDPFIVD